VDDDLMSGWVFFSAIVLIVVGIIRIFDAIWAFRYNGALPENLSNAIFGDSLKTYAWIYLIVGVLLILAGISLIAGSQLGRWVGIAAAALAALSAMPWLPYYPIWSLLYVGIAVLTIYALVAHGGRDVSNL
jgi:hypothetical protein